MLSIRRRKWRIKWRIKWMCVDFEYKTHAGEPHPEALVPARTPIATVCQKTDGFVG